MAALEPADHRGRELREKGAPGDAGRERGVAGLVPGDAGLRVVAFGDVDQLGEGVGVADLQGRRRLDLRHRRIGRQDIAPGGRSRRSPRGDDLASLHRRIPGTIGAFRSEVQLACGAASQEQGEKGRAKALKRSHR